jgi:peptide/nickel transport system substrate-binding protein/microcin C transport system substrate-binding protein
MYQEDLRRVGIVMDIRLMEWNALSKSVDEKSFDAIGMSWGGGDVDLDPKQIWHSASAARGGSNFVNYSNPQVDKLIDEGRAELSKPKRIALFRKVYDLIADDAPYAFFFNGKYLLYGASRKVGRPKDAFPFASPYSPSGWPFWWMLPQPGASK